MLQDDLLYHLWIERHAYARHNHVATVRALISFDVTSLPLQTNTVPILNRNHDFFTQVWKGRAGKSPIQLERRGRGGGA